MIQNKAPSPQYVTFSQSKFWEVQLNYFDTMGIDAWAKGEVPHYATSNVLLAHSYAQLAGRYIQDNLRNGTIDPNHPIYFF